MDAADEINFTEFPKLQTKRLILRELALSDADDIFVFRSDAYVQRFNAKPMKDVSEARDLVERNKAVFERQDGILWGVTLKKQDTVIGIVGFGQWSYSNRAMLGYDFAREHWGKGFANETVREIIRFGYEKMVLNRIEAETIDDNHESSACWKS